MLGIGPQEIAFIVLIVAVLFGAKRIPEVMRGLGQGLREFKDASKQVAEDLRPLTDPDSDTIHTDRTV